MKLAEEQQLAASDVGCDDPGRGQLGRAGREAGSAPALGFAVFARGVPPCVPPLTARGFETGGGTAEARDPGGRPGPRPSARGEFHQQLSKRLAACPRVAMQVSGRTSGAQRGTRSLQR